MSEQKRSVRNNIKSKAASKGSSSSKRTYTRRKKKENLNLAYEIIVMTFVVFAILMILSIYLNSGGIVGKFIRELFFGIFGVGAYLLPAYVLGASILKIFNKDNHRLNHKLELLFLLVLGVSALTHVFYIEKAQINREIMGKNTFFPALVNYFSVSLKDHKVGGFIGGLIGDLIAILLGKAGSLLVLVLINISIIILLTEQSFFKLMKIIGTQLQSLSKNVYNTSKAAIEEKHKQIKHAKSEKDSKEDLFMQQIEKQEKSAKSRENLLKKATIIDDEKQSPLSVKNTPNTTEDVVTEEEVFTVQPIGSNIDNDKLITPVQISFFQDAVKPKQEKVDIKDTEFIKKEMVETVNKTLYEHPPLQLLKDNPVSGVKGSVDETRKNAEKLEQTLESFGVKAKVINISYGPTVTRYELQPEVGVKVSRIVNLSDDIALNLAASGIRMEAPIPGKSLIGIEVPNKEVSSVYIKEVINTPEFQKFPSKIAFALGKDISGDTIIADIAKMPHLLISGSTGSGKSVCINTLITSMLYKANPNEVKLLMIDPKVVELKVYNGIPHLLIPVVTDPKKAAGALYWAVQEMSERYQLFANANVRDLSGYNRMVSETGELKKLPQIVIIVDELADLMQVAAKEVEDAICRLAQMARAAGIHLILATQRPSVDVITGLIKANVPSRIAFAVSSGIDSRTIIDMNGAEKLVGKGDMLYYPVGMPKPLRVQGAFISDKEVEHVVEFLKASQKVHYDKEIMDQISKEKTSNESEDKNDGEFDSYFDEALELIVDMQKASASMLQRKFRVGYNRAARIIDQLYEAGYIGPDEGSKPRRVNITMEEYYRMKHAVNEEAVNDEVSATDEDDLF